ncbi:family 3 adenylate cyclase [Bradyrhizobium sp. YR681]|nr:family 3 adenylate cyclase [Bradyrhizobium sp. YR681]
MVGNIGSRRRFNYTVMSDTVNVASRLEGANKYYGTAIMASETTVAQTGDSFAWRELDAIKVIGRGEAIKVFEPLAERGAENAGQAKVATAYAEGLACWRARDFAKAADAFGRTAEIDTASALFGKRAGALAANPPPTDWSPVNILEGK